MHAGSVPLNGFLSGVPRRDLQFTVGFRQTLNPNPQGLPVEGSERRPGQNPGATQQGATQLVQYPFLASELRIRYLGGCQDYGPSLGPYYITAPNI